MNQMPPTQSQSLAIQQQQHHHHHQQLQQLQQQNSLPPSNSTVGSWYGVSAGRHGEPPQQSMGVNRNFPSNTTGIPDGYIMTSSISAGGGGGRNMVPYYEGTTMQKVSPNHMAPEYKGQRMMSGHLTQNGFLSNGGLMQKGYGQNDLMLDPSSVAMPTHQMMSSGVGSRQMQVISPNADYYQDQRMAYAAACRPMQSQPFDACASDQSSTTMEGVHRQMGLKLSPNTMVCRDTRGSLPQQQRHQSSSQRVMPYPNPQQYMQNKRAQYNVIRRKMYDYDPAMQQYNNGCYGNGWPRQSLPLPQQPLVSPDYPGGLPCHIKEEADSYYQMARQNQRQPMMMWPSNREPAQLRNNAFSPPPGNPTPPMTPGSTSMPCNAPDAASDVVRSNGLRMFRENELYFTFPVHEGMIKAPFQLEHNVPVTCHIFNLNDQLHESLMARPDLELMLKCFHKEDRLLATNWPASVSIHLNEVPLMIDRGATPTCPHQPIFLKSICKPGQNTLQLSVTTCCCSHLFVLQIVHRPSVRSFFQGLITKRLLPASNTMGKIKRLLSQVTIMPSTSTNEQQHMPLPLTCPLSMQRIVVPARGRDCQHIQCFDLENYLKFNCQRSHWHCPFCKKMATLDGLEVDQFIWGVLDHLSSASSDAVLLDISANWKPLPKPGAEYGSESNGIYKKFVMADAMPLPSPGNYSMVGKGGMAVPPPSFSSVSHQKEMALQERHQKTAAPSETPNYLGCLSQMTNVFLGPDSSPSVAPQSNNMEHMSFPPTPMGSQISQICTPLDGQSLHPRTPSEGHSSTHPHTPPDGHPFTPLDSQSQLYGKSPPEHHGGTVGINTSAAAFDSCGSSRRRTSTTTAAAAADGHSASTATVRCSGSNSSEAGISSECGGKQDQSGERSGGRGEDFSESLENPLLTEDLTKLDFKSNLSLCDNDDNQDPMISLLPDGLDYDQLDLTCYLGGGGGSSGTRSPANKTTSKDLDDDFLSFMN